MTVTPVLADQLEDARRGRAAAPLPGRVADRRRRSRPAAGAGGVPGGLRGRSGALRARPGAARRGRRRPAGALPAGRGRGADRARDLRRDPRRAAAAGDPAGPAAAARRRHPLAPPPLRLGRRLLAARVRLRRRAWSGGWPSAGVRWFCVDQSAHAEPLDALAPVADRGRARWRCRSTGRRSPGSGRSTATPPIRPTPSSPANRCAGSGSGRSAAAPTTRPRPRPPRAARPASSSPPSRPGSAPTPQERGRRGLLVFAIDTELLGHWWSEGADLAAGRCSRAPRRPGSGCSPCRRRWPSTSRSSARCAPRPGARSKDLRTWDSPPVADLAWGARRLELRLLRALSRRPARRRRDARRPRAARRPGERLGLPRPARPGGRLRLPAGHRPRPGDVGGHRLRPATDPRMRSLAPDLSLAPLLEP